MMGKGPRVVGCRAAFRRLRRGVSCCWCVAPFLGCAAEPEPEGPIFELDIPVERMTLANGLEVVVVPNHTAPVVTALIAIRAGSAAEDVALNGYSHLFEHMIFQGSEAVSDTKEFHDRLDDLGVSHNGTTSVDRVTYYFVAERDALDPALELFAGAIINPALDPTLLEKEKQVVLGEFDINESDADFLRYRRTLSELFGAYATRLDPLGDRSAVNAASADALRAMHRQYYVPNNALLVLSGDVTRSDAEALANRHFGSWQRGPDPLLENPPALPTALGANRYLVMTAPVTFSEIEVWWQGPSLDDDPEGTLAGQLLSDVTYQTDHDFRELVGPTLSVGAGLGLRVMRRTSYIRATFTVLPGSEATFIEALRLALISLGARYDVTEEQLDTAKAQSFFSYLSTSSNPASLPHAVADDWAIADSKRFFNYVDKLYTVDVGALTRFAENYIRRKPYAMVLMSNASNLAAQRIDASWLLGRME